MGIKIIGIGSGLPQRIVTNDELAGMVDTSNEWIVSRTGIECRHVCTTETLTDLCEVACKKALERSGLTTADIDLVICSTISGDFVTPSQACAVSERIGTTCPAFDVNGACSGFIYVLDMAEAYIDTGRAKNILLICCEQMSKHADWDDRATCVLFGDGAAACVVTKGSALKYVNLTSKGQTDILRLPTGNGNTPFAERKVHGCLHMEGQAVFRFAVSAVEQAADMAVEALGITPEDIDYYVLHQANKRIIDSARNKLKLPPEKFPLCVQKYGNMSSATIPILLEQMLTEGTLTPGKTIFMAAFGAGLTTGTAVMTWE